MILKKMLQNITSSRYHNKAIRLAKPLYDHFGINHFWYYKITTSGQYSFFGTHREWNEFFFGSDLIKLSIPYLKHPDSITPGISLMKKNQKSSYKKFLKVAWDKFNINFNIHLINKIPAGVEGFGFATHNNHESIDEILLNELPLLHYFTNFFRENNRRLFDVIENNQVDLAYYLGESFTQKADTPDLIHNRQGFLKKMGLGSYLTLSQREQELLKLFSSGYPASFIANQLELSPRTVESYTVNLKAKLQCHSKVDLIKKAQFLSLVKKNGNYIKYN